MAHVMYLHYVGHKLIIEIGKGKSFSQGPTYTHVGNLFGAFWLEYL